MAAPGAKRDGSARPPVGTTCLVGPRRSLAGTIGNAVGGGTMLEGCEFLSACAAADAMAAGDLTSELLVEKLLARIERLEPGSARSSTCTRTTRGPRPGRPMPRGGRPCGGQVPRRARGAQGHHRHRGPGHDRRLEGLGSRASLRSPRRSCAGSSMRASSSSARRGRSSSRWARGGRTRTWEPLEPVGYRRPPGSGREQLRFRRECRGPHGPVGHRHRHRGSVRIPRRGTDSRASRSPWDG